MGQPFVGEIRMFGGNFAPLGWAFCDGSLLAIAQNDTLFQLIGTTYGGDGQTTFALPDLQGRVPMHDSTNAIGEKAGVESVTLTTQQMPSHSHALFAANVSASSLTPAASAPAIGTKRNYTTAGTPAPMHPSAIGAAGGNQPHDNMGPYTVVSCIISLSGIFPAMA